MAFEAAGASGVDTKRDLVLTMTAITYYEPNGSPKPRACESVLVRSLSREFIHVGALTYVTPDEAVLLADVLHLAERVAPAPRKGAR